MALLYIPEITTRSFPPHPPSATRLRPVVLLVSNNTRWFHVRRSLMGEANHPKPIPRISLLPGPTH